MPRTQTINVPLNRVEGDLEIRAEVDGGVVRNVWCSGTMYRGFERIMVGRGALDGLVITPRICGICSTSHLTAAVLALDMIAGIAVPPDAVRIRNISLMTEYIQSDIRQGFLMFAVDFANPAYRNCALFEEAVCRYEPFKGKTLIEVIRETKKIIEIIAIIGGQWPHSSYMVPGGIVSVPSASDLLQCRLMLRQFRNWYERRILGCTLERWLDVRSGTDLDAWLEESDTHRESDIGFYIRFGRAIGLDRIGRGHDSFISYGSFELPDETQVRGPRDDGHLIPSGFAQGKKIHVFDQAKVSEHVANSWFVDYEGGRHPFEGETQPYASGQEGKKYSWAKAPRYDGLPAETGPLAEMIIAGNPLFTDLVGRNGPSVFTRELSRLVRPAQLIPAMEVWLSETTGDGKFYRSPKEIIEGRGFGLTEAARGALGHWVRIDNGKIAHYQVIPPTTWNASPRDSSGTMGPVEEALVGVEIQDVSNPVELGHVVRSFDPCLVCTVHTVNRGRDLGSVSLSATP
jgi:Ni,Fe-hydrogenase I large subunit